MKRTLPLIFILISLACQSQIISKFTWNTVTQKTKSDIGPDAISISKNSFLCNSGFGGTKGLNAGNSKETVDMKLPGYFYNIPGIDISLSFRRDQLNGSFFKRGDEFNFGMYEGHLAVMFKVKTSVKTQKTVVAANVYKIPDDGEFHQYRFRYTASTGKAELWFDNTVVYTFSGVPGQALYWNESDDVLIGDNLRGSESNLAVLDNIIIQNSAAISSLPLQLVSFNAAVKNSNVNLFWATVREENTNSFEVERSVDGSQFNSIETIGAAGKFDVVNNYRTYDDAIKQGVAYYRLKMIDIDGKFTYSPIRKVNISEESKAVTLFPNPATDFVTIQFHNEKPASFSYIVSTSDGRQIQSGSVQVGMGIQQIKVDLTRTNEKGVMFIRLTNANTNVTETFKVVKN